MDDEQSFRAAVDDLYKAVAALADPIKEFVGGRVLAAPSLYEQLAADIPAKATGDAFSRGVGRSLPPVWCDAVDLRRNIDDRVQAWQPAGASTPARLRALASRRWRPQDARAISDIAAETHSFVAAIRALLEPAHVKEIAAPCPSCNRRWHYRQHAGEQIRTAALQVVADVGCTCHRCKAFWPPERYWFLMRLLGLETPEGVVG